MTAWKFRWLNNLPGPWRRWSDSPGGARSCWAAPSTPTVSTWDSTSGRPEEPVSNGARPLPPEQYYARLAQRILSFLTVMTPSGRLYEVDTRLRPNGRAGSLVSSIGAFRDYQVNQAWTWELQALTRAHYVAGQRSVQVRFDRIRRAM